MAKIKVDQQGGEVRISRAGETATTYKASQEGLITVRKDAVAEVLRLIPGSELVEGTLEDEVVDETTLPASDVLPTEEELAAQREAEAKAAAKTQPKRTS